MANKTTPSALSIKTLSSTGHITIPLGRRHALRLEPGDQLKLTVVRGRLHAAKVMGKGVTAR